MNRRLQPLLGLIACLSVAGGVMASIQPAAASRPGQNGSGGAPPPISSPIRPRPIVSPTSRPNIVFVLTDDLSMNLLRYMPHVLAMQQTGMTFKNYFVSDSLCCPSRSSIFTGDFPHNTHVFSNFGPHGGFRAFHAHGDERHTLAVALQAAGYQTALMGKYLNGYLQLPGEAGDGTATNLPATYIPPGWSEWDVAGWGYPEFNYTLNQDGVLNFYGSDPSDYLTDVLANNGTAFINQAAASRKPFFLELSTFAPHSPYVPAPRDAGDFPGLTAPRPPSFNTLPTNAPRWLANHPPLDATQTGQIDTVFRQRAQAVQAVDRLIGTIEATLAADGVARNTYLVFSSDNGLHTGEYRLMPGKLTAFDTDIHVPLVIDGPGIPAGAKVSAMTENIDLAPTFTALGGTSLPADGHSLTDLFDGTTPPDWRSAVLIEHHGSGLSGGDPDYQQPAAGAPWTYEAMRTSRFLYVEYDDGEREFYDLRSDPFELHNMAASLTRAQRKQLHIELAALKRCHGAVACWAASHVGTSVQAEQHGRPRARTATPSH